MVKILFLRGECVVITLRYCNYLINALLSFMSHWFMTFLSYFLVYRFSYLMVSGHRVQGASNLGKSLGWGFFVLLHICTIVYNDLYCLYSFDDI